jgi:hypothetical protein
MRLRTGHVLPSVALAGAMVVLGACGGSDKKAAQTTEPAKVASIKLAQELTGVRGANAVEASRIPQVSLPEGRGPLGVEASGNASSGSTQAVGYDIK